jgi:hypothetical protein
MHDEAWYFLLHEEQHTCLGHAIDPQTQPVVFRDGHGDFPYSCGQIKSTKKIVYFFSRDEYWDR